MGKFAENLNLGKRVRPPPSIPVTQFRRPQAADRRLKNFKVTGRDSLGMGVGVGKAISQSK